MKFSTITLLAIASIIALSSDTSEEPDWRKTFNICFKLLRTSPEARALRNQNSFNLDPELQCVTRCSGIITELYDDETGISMKYLDAWRDRNGIDHAHFEKYKMKYQTCAAEIKPEQYGDDYCKKSFKYHECLQQKDEN